jgi:hypothetical protein
MAAAPLRRGPQRGQVPRQPGVAGGGRQRREPLGRLSGRAAGLRQQLTVQRAQVAAFDGRREPNRSRDDRELGLARARDGRPVGAAQDDVGRQLQSQALRQVGSELGAGPAGLPGQGLGDDELRRTGNMRGDVDAVAGFLLVDRGDLADPGGRAGQAGELGELGSDRGGHGGQEARVSGVHADRNRGPAAGGRVANRLAGGRVVQRRDGDHAVRVEAAGAGQRHRGPGRGQAGRGDHGGEPAHPGDGDTQRAEDRDGEARGEHHLRDGQVGQVLVEAGHPGGGADVERPRRQR